MPKPAKPEDQATSGFLTLFSEPLQTEPARPTRRAREAPKVRVPQKESEKSPTQMPKHVVFPEPSHSLTVGFYRQTNQSQLWIPRKPRKIGVWVSSAEIQPSAVDTRTAVWVSTAEKFSKIVLGETGNFSRKFRGVSAPALYRDLAVIWRQQCACFQHVSHPHLWGIPFWIQEETQMGHP